MVSDGGSKRNWLHLPSTRLAGALLIASVVAGLLWVWLRPPSVLVPERQGAQQQNTDYQAASGPCDPKRLARITREAARADKERACAKEQKDDAREDAASTQAYRVTNATEEALRLARSQADVAFAQAILTALAVAFTGWAALEAARAAKAAQDSVADARQGAAEQTARFTAQLEVARSAAKAAQLSAEAAVSAQRPWIKIDVGHIEAKISETQALVTITYSYTNYGNSPAIVPAFTDITPIVCVLSRNPLWIAEEVARRIGDSQFDDADRGQAVFPGEPTHHRMTINVDIEPEIDHFGLDNTIESWPYTERDLEVFVGIGVDYSFAGGRGRTEAIVRGYQDPPVTRNCGHVFLDVKRMHTLDKAS